MPRPTPRTALRAALLLPLLLLAPPAPATVLCDGVCEVLGAPPEHGDTPFDFVLGIAADEGIDLYIQSGGSIYVYGEIQTTGDASLDAGGGILLPPGVGDTNPGGGAIVIACCDSPSIVPLTASSATPTQLFVSPGDIYVDVQGALLSSLVLDAAVAIVVSADTPVSFVPEPGTAALLLFGLVAAGALRRVS